VPSASTPSTSSTSSTSLPTPSTNVTPNGSSFSAALVNSCGTLTEQEMLQLQVLDSTPGSVGLVFKQITDELNRTLQQEGVVLDQVSSTTQGICTLSFAWIYDYCS
jgi:hypothetical protein